jgi:hypothetical protein
VGVPVGAIEAPRQQVEIIAIIGLATRAEASRSAAVR